MSDFEDSGEWDVAINKKKINRQVRKERKEAEAASSTAPLGAYEGEEFNAEERRQRAAATFYGMTKAEQRKKAGRQKKHVGPPPDLDFEEAGWTGGGILGEQKKKKAKSKAAAIPQYNTADEVAEALSDIISRVPPTSKGITTTIASLGDKLQTITKQAWNKRYKSDFGTMKKFLESRSEFAVNGDEVGLSASGAKRGTKSGTPVKKSKHASGGNNSTGSNGEEEYSDEEEDESAADPASPRKRRSQDVKTESTCSVGTIIATLVLVGVTAGGYYYWQHFIRK